MQSKKITINKKSIDIIVKVFVTLEFFVIPFATNTFIFAIRII